MKCSVLFVSAAIAAAVIPQNASAEDGAVYDPEPAWVSNTTGGCHGGCNSDYPFLCDFDRRLTAATQQKIIDLITPFNTEGHVSLSKVCLSKGRMAVMVLPFEGDEFNKNVVEGHAYMNGLMLGNYDADTRTTTPTGCQPSSLIFVVLGEDHTAESYYTQVYGRSAPHGVDALGAQVFKIITGVDAEPRGEVNMSGELSPSTDMSVFEDNSKSSIERM